MAFLKSSKPTSVGGVEGEPQGEHGDCGVVERMHRGRGGNIEGGTAGSRCQRLRTVGGPQHAQVMSRSRRAESSRSGPRECDTLSWAKSLVLTSADFRWAKFEVTTYHPLDALGFALLRCKDSYFKISFSFPFSCFLYCIDFLSDFKFLYLRVFIS